QVIEISAEGAWGQQGHFATSIVPALAAAACRLLAATFLVVIDEQRECRDACEDGEVFEIASRARCPGGTQQRVAMDEARGGSERGLNALAEDQPAAHVFVRPEPDHTSAHYAERLRLCATDRSAPD